MSIERTSIHTYIMLTFAYKSTNNKIRKLINLDVKVCKNVTLNNRNCS